jgi:hypothetical protein
MRLEAQTDGSEHGVGGPDDHHPRPKVVTISNTTQSLPPGTTFNLDIPVGSDQFKFARCQLLGSRHMYPSGSAQWSECAEVLVTRDTAEAMGHSQRDLAFKKVYSATYSKLNGDSYLTHKIFDSLTGISQRYIALVDAVLTGSNLRLTFRNYHGGSAFLWVKGQALLW